MKGQMVFEFVIAAVIFFGIVFYALSYLGNSFGVYSNDFYSSILQSKVVQVADFVTRGEGNWTDTPVVIGLAQGWPVLNSTKIKNLGGYCATNYTEIQTKLNLLDRPHPVQKLYYDVRIEVNETDFPNAYYKFDESGTVAGDSSPNGRTGTAVNVERTSVCRSGQCLKFNGTTGQVNLPDLGLRQSFTIEAWTNATNIPGQDGEILYKENSYRLFVNQSRFVGFQIFNSTDNATIFSTAAIARNWTHVAVVYNSTGLALYVNGVLNRSAAFSGAINNSAAQNPVRIGATAIGSNRFNGTVDELAAWDVAKDAQWVGRDYSSGYSDAVNIMTCGRQITGNVTSAKVVRNAVNENSKPLTLTYLIW